jgi:hypothetical protein
VFNLKICKECNQEFKNQLELTFHIKKEHNLTKKEYYDKYLKLPGDGYCKTCGKEVSWKKDNSGYKKYCNSKCQRNDPENESKMKQTMIDKYGDIETFKKENYKKRNKTMLKKYGTIHALQNKEIKNKMNDKILKKYGTTNVSKVESIKNKIKETVKSKYGVEHISQLEFVQEKIKNTNLEKYGTEYSINSEKVRNKIEQTNYEKYGTKTPFENKELQNKIQNINLQKYGTKTPFENKELQNKIQDKLKIRYYNMIKERLDNYKDYQLLTTLDEYLKNGSNAQINPMRFKHLSCGNEFDYLVYNGSYPYCPICNPWGKSNKEIEVSDYISSLDINENDIILNDRSGISGKNKELDIYLPKYNLAIEFDGVYWHSEKFLPKDYHLTKTEQCESNGIQLLHIFENEWINPIKQDIWKSIISTKLNKNKKIYGRNTYIEIIDNKLSKQFLDENHLQGYIYSEINIGLFHKNELVSVITFGKPRFNKNYEFELIRFANKKYTSIIGGFSKLLKYFKRNYKPSSIITYADRRISNGNLYEKTGFKFLKNTDPNYFYTNDFNTLHSRNKFQKHKLKNLLEDFNSNLSEHENMLNNNYYRIYDCGNKVYLNSF